MISGRSTAAISQPFAPSSADITSKVAEQLKPHLEHVDVVVVVFDIKEFWSRCCFHNADGRLRWGSASRVGKLRAVSRLRSRDFLDKPADGRTPPRFFAHCAIDKPITDVSEGNAPPKRYRSGQFLPHRKCRPNRLLL